MDSKARIVSSRVIYDGKKLRIREDRVIEPGVSGESIREIVEHPGAVCIVARPSPDEVILIRQYRHATGGVLVELPAGTLDNGEDPRHCAIRELEEETGYAAGKMIERGKFWTTPGFTSELMYLFEASELTKTQINPDEDEVIDVDITPVAEALKMVEDGRIQDAKSIAGLLRVLK